MIKHKAYKPSLEFIMPWLPVLMAAIAALAVVLFAGFFMQSAWAGEFGMASKLAEQSSKEHIPIEANPVKKSSVEPSPKEHSSKEPSPKEPSQAANLQSEEKLSSKFLGLLADIRIHSAEELLEVLTRVDNLFTQGQIQAGVDQPIVFLLHGNEAKTLFKSAYNQHKQVVDLAARLSAFAVVDIKVCETWMGGNGLDKSNLQPFVGTVPYAVGEERRLLKEQGYTFF